jgi:hypothetical protein
MMCDVHDPDSDIQAADLDGLDEELVNQFVDRVNAGRSAADR